MKIGIGIYGSNGHQIHRQLKNNPRADLVEWTISKKGEERKYRPLEDNEKAALAYIYNDRWLKHFSTGDNRRANPTQSVIVDAILTNLDIKNWNAYSHLNKYTVNSI